MGGQVAVIGSEISEPPHQKLEVESLLGGYADPIVKKGAGQLFARKSRDEIPGQIYRVEFDMREGVKQRGAPCR